MCICFSGTFWPKRWSSVESKWISQVQSTRPWHWNSAKTMRKYSWTLKTGHCNCSCSLQTFEWYCTLPSTWALTRDKVWGYHQEHPTIPNTQLAKRATVQHQRFCSWWRWRSAKRWPWVHRLLPACTLGFCLALGCHPLSGRSLLRLL